MSSTHRTDGHSRRPVMTSRRWLGLAVSAATAVAVISAGSSAMAASGGTPGTNVRTAPVAAAQQPQAAKASPAATATTPTYASATQAFPAATTVNMATSAYSAGVCPSGTTTFTGLTITYTG